MEREVGASVLDAVVLSLGQLLNYEWGLDKTAKDGLTSLKYELISMHAFLWDVSGMPPDLQLELQVKLRAREVRELSRAIETRLRSFVVRMWSTKGALLATISKMTVNNEIGSYIEDALIKIREMRGRYGPYHSKNSLEITSTQLSLPMYNRESNPIGIDGAVDDLIKKLYNRDYVSIFGMGGMSKITLAQAVYDKMKGGFDCEAFVPIGLRADVKKVLMDIFNELRIEIHGHAPDEYQLLSQLQDFLVDKRCLLVIDDIRDEETWNFVEHVFKGSAGSKIITTTRNLSIAEGVGDAVYTMKPLSLANLKELLRTKAEVKSHDTEYDTLSDKILRKCGGVPITISTIGSFLGKIGSKEWQRVYDSNLYFELMEDGAFKYIRQVLSYSYYALPYSIQKCFLYLSLFPEDHWIDKNMLIWRWVAEGLVPGGLFELGESYFNELIDRSMIQWAVSPSVIGQDGCRVHTLMLDLIRFLSSSKELNFSTVIGMKQESTSQTGPIHRLAIHFSQNQKTRLEVGKVLSFCASTCTGSSFPLLEKFKQLRVIDLEGCD